MSDHLRLLVADYGPTRLGVRLTLADTCDVCAEAADADETIAAAAREQPDLCLIGLELPGGAIAAVRGVRAAAQNAAVIVLIPGDATDDLIAVIRAGAMGCVSARADANGLKRVVEAVAAGEAAIPRAMTSELVREVQGAQAGDGLTAREAQVLALVREGESTAAIADRLAISPVTVRRHISTLVQKTGVEDRAALADVTRPNGRDGGQGSARSAAAR
jgi:DNA-binding NarL/FixJ family response regulator